MSIFQWGWGREHMKMEPDSLTPILPPCPDSWQGTEHVEALARQILAALGLSDWEFGWDRARRRLGACHLGKKRVTLSRYFAEHCFANGEAVGLYRTFLHEVAHALCSRHGHERGHGPRWKAYCAALGIAGERAMAPRGMMPEVEEGEARYLLVHSETGEVFARYRRRPRRSARQWKRCYIPRRREETLGKLVVVEVEGANEKCTMNNEK